MKKLISILTIAILSFATITSCTNEVQTAIEENGINITIIGGDKDLNNDSSNTKTYVSEEGNTVHVYWQNVETEKLMVYELIDNGDTDIRYNESLQADIKDGGVTAEFQTSIYGETPTGEHTYKYTAIYPSSCASKSDGKYRVEIPQVQNLNGTNLAPDADVLVGVPHDNGNTRIAEGATIPYQFKRFGTTVKMTLKGISKDETVNKVEITAPKGISGFGVVDLTSGEVTETTGHKTSITLNLNQVVDETTNISVWFRVLSGTWTVSKDKPLKVVVTTDAATYTKEITAIASTENNLEFAEGGLTTLGISGMTRDENSAIEDGEYVITAVNVSTNYIMLAYESGNNIKSETYTLNEDGNFVFNASSTHEPEECVYTFTRVTEGDYKGYYTIKDHKGNYLYAAGDNSGGKNQNYLKAYNPETKDDTYYWLITYVDEEYSITAKSSNSNQLKFNSASNQLMFSCYTSGQTAVTLYPASKLVIDRTPRIEVSAEELNYAADGTTKDSQITVKAKYCEGLSATSNDEWISNISISEGVLVLTVSANTVVQERQGVITISSTTADVESKSITIKQAAHSDQPQGGDGIINFGNGDGDCAIDDTSVTGTDSNFNEWMITTSGTTYFGQNANYSQIGSSNNPASSITFTTTLPDNVQITDFSAKFGGFSGTAGTVELKVGETEVGSGSLASTDVTVNIDENKKGTIGKVLTVTVTGISKGVKAYYISYAYEPIKAVESIAIKTAPTQTTYFVGEKFNPAGLVITATYDDASTKDIAYAGNESKFTFNPTLDAELQTSNNSIEITYGEKSTTQNITVKTRPEFTVTPSNNAAEPILIGEGEYNGEPISVIVGTDVVWTVAKVSGDDVIEFTEGGTSSGSISVKIDANTGAARNFVLRVSSSTAGVSPASYDVYLHQDASSTVTTIALATPTGLAYDDSTKKLTWNAVTTDVNGTALVEYIPTYQINIDNSGWKNASSPFALSTLSAGSHTAQLKAIGNGTVYGDSEASDLYEFTKSNPTWKLVTDASTLKAGDKIVIASRDKGKSATDITSDYMGEVASTFSTDKNTITSLGTGTVELTIGGSSDAWTLTNSSGKKLGSTAVKKVAWDSETTTWSISISNGNATIQNGKDAYGRFLHNVNSTRFTTYTSATNASMLLPQIYRYE
ncbi:MAG: bacterial Ig-like domain-containing protein [Alistipes sp.]|nr:bacterial Ig-like domain-containing protein [Candidatus Alistipes equi]